MKSTIRILKISVLSILAIGVTSNPSLQGTGSRQIACVASSGDPEVINLETFPIQPNIFQFMEPDSSTSASHYYDLLTQADQGYLNYSTLISASFGYTLEPMPSAISGSGLASTGYLSGSPWGAFSNLAPSPLFSSKNSSVSAMPIF